MRKLNPQTASITLFSLLALGACAHTRQADTQTAHTDAVTDANRNPASYVVSNYPILDALEASGQKLSDETKSWMKKWKGMDLDDESQYQFKELSGSTSINLKIQKIDSTDPKGYKSRGSFVPRNGAANPDAEIAYFNLAAILGYDYAFRPAARYELGSRASQALKRLIGQTTIRGSNRLENKARILKEIASGNPLKGCVKAKKLDSESALETMASSSIGPTGGPKPSHPIVAALQASNSKPQAGTSLTLKPGYVGDALELAREYSVLMMLDSIFEQWDRYSGGNIVIAKDEAGKAHFYATDNGGADVSKSGSWAQRNRGWFSRYDRKAIERLRQVHAFLKNPSTGFLGYTSAERFVVDLGLYSQLPPAAYVERITRNIGALLDRVHEVEAKAGANAYLD